MNRECYPASLFPLEGDLSAGAGATSVEVIGLQNIPLAPNPLVDGNVPTYVLADNEIEWLPPSTVSYFKINGIGVSQDGLFFVNGTMRLGTDDLFGLEVNGTRIN